MTRDEIDAAISESMKSLGLGTVLPMDRLIWDAACEACAKACAPGDALLDAEYAAICRSLKATR